MKYAYYGGMLIPPPLCTSVHYAERRIHKISRQDEKDTIFMRVGSGIKLAKFFLFDLSVSLGALFISREAGSSLIFKALTENGPVVMKLGQFLSTRTDILSNCLVSKLKTIQSKAPVTKEKDFRHPLDILYEETGVSLPYSSLKGQIGAGCISQVYKVEIGRHAYALKIIDKKTREKIRSDLEVFEIFSKLLGMNRFYQEFKRNMCAQMDLRKEKGNTERFRRNFALFQSPLENRSVFVKILSFFNKTSVIFPKPVAATKNILLTEYWKGRELGAGNGESVLLLFFKMVFNDRFVHSDLHPGNISVIPTDTKNKNKHKDQIKNKTIIVYDTGLAHEITKEQNRNLIDLVKALLLNRKKEALSLIIDRNRMNTHTKKEKSVFLKSAIDYWDRSTTKNTNILGKALGIYFLAQRHRVFLDSAYTNLVMSGLYMQEHLKEIEGFSWVSALKSGTLLDYLDLFVQWKIDQMQKNRH